MANTFGILAALVLAFAAYVASKNKTSLQEELTDIASEQKSYKQNQDTFTELKAQIDQLDDETQDFQLELKDREAKIDQQNAKNTEVETQIAEKEAEAKEAENKADEADEVLKELGDVADLIPELKRLKSSIADLDDQISVSDTEVSTLENSKATNSTEAKDLAQQLSSRNTGKSYFVTTRVRSVYRNWGFVTLGAGDNSGVVAKSKLKVLRGDEEICQLIVTAVEDNTAAANIIPSTVNPELDISVGDVVVPFEEAAAE